MRIKRNKEILAFFDRCLTAVQNEYKNEFIGAYVDHDNESELQEQMQTAGFQEFGEDRSKWPSLFISAEAYQKTPYQSTIRLDTIKHQDFQFSKEVMPANELFHVSSIHYDKNRELGDWMTLRALDQPYEAAVLWQNDEVWMLDSPSEANTIDPCAAKAKGNVLAFGLGIGYFIFMAMRNPNVTSITVIERSKEVIAMFQEFLLPQFPDHIPIQIVEGDAFSYFNEGYLKQFDYVFADIWKSSDDGFQLIAKLLEQYNPPLDQVDFWIESSCFEFMPTLIFYYFKEMSLGKKIQHPDPMYRHVLQKIEAYFKRIHDTVSTVDQLKYFMYDTAVLREIASTKI